MNLLFFTTPMPEAAPSLLAATEESSPQDAESLGQSRLLVAAHCPLLLWGTRGRKLPFWSPTPVLHSSWLWQELWAPPCLNRVLGNLRSVQQWLQATSGGRLYSPSNTQRYTSFLFSLSDGHLGQRSCTSPFPCFSMLSPCCCRY